MTIYKVDTATGQSTSYPFQATGYDYTFFDVAILSDGKALITQDFSGSGWTRLKLLDPTTGQYSLGADVRQSSVLTRSATGETVLIAEPNSSGGPLNVYRTGTGVVAHTGASGFNWGIQAFNGTLAANYIYNEGINIYNSALQLQTTLISTGGWDWRHGRVADLLLDASGQHLFVLDNAANAIVQLRTSDWTLVQSIPVNATVGSWAGQVGASSGSRLILDPQGRYFSVATQSGLVLVANPDAPAMAGTAGADTMIGTLFDDSAFGNEGGDSIDGGDGDDILDGGEGDDTLIGGTGADEMTGGIGNDIYAVDSVGDAVIEDAGAGIDEIRTTLATYSLAGLANVENLTALNADTLAAGNQAFSWIGSGAFSGSAGQLRAYEQNGTWFVEGDVNGDSVADLVIALTLQGLTPLGAGDFLL